MDFVRLRLILDNVMYAPGARRNAPRGARRQIKGIVGNGPNKSVKEKQ